jgi:hypothetical protein
MRTIARALGPAGLMTALLVTACGPSPTPSSSAATASAAPVAAPIPNACDLLTEAVAKKYLGQDAKLTRKYQPNPQMTQCQWSGGGGVIAVMAGPWSMVHTGSPVETAVSGIGDEAYQDPTQLFVRKADRGVSINIIVASGEFWGAAADSINAQTAAAEKKVAPDLIANL